jgi:hypothetical protein
VIRVGLGHCGVRAGLVLGSREKRIRGGVVSEAKSGLNPTLWSANEWICSLYRCHQLSYDSFRSAWMPVTPALL